MADKGAPLIRMVELDEAAKISWYRPGNQKRCSARWQFGMRNIHECDSLTTTMKYPLFAHDLACDE